MVNYILKFMLILGICILTRAVIDDTFIFFVTYIFIAIPLQGLWDKIMMIGE